MVSWRVQELTDTEDSDLAVWGCIDKREGENAIIKLARRSGRQAWSGRENGRNGRKDEVLRSIPAAEMTPAARMKRANKSGRKSRQ